MFRRFLGWTSCARLSAILVVSATVAQSASATKEAPKAKEEAGKLVGTWEGYAVEGKGEKIRYVPVAPIAQWADWGVSCTGKSELRSNVVTVTLPLK